MKNVLFCLVLLSVSIVKAAAAPLPADRESIAAALRQMYNSQFESSRAMLSAYSFLHPADPLAYSLCAASYLFSELDRSGALSRSLLKDERSLARPDAGHVDESTAAGLSDAVSQARSHAQALLAINPRDTNALLALCIVSGVQRDYLALVEHKLRESYEYIKESQEYSSRLLEADPTAYDAYLSKGFTEYLVASLPFYLRWPMRLDNVSGSKQQGLHDLQIAAESGRYLKPFAQLLLAMFYLRENQRGQTEKLLAQLTHDYPENPAFAEELRKLAPKRSSRE